MNAIHSQYIVFHSYKGRNTTTCTTLRTSKSAWIQLKLFKSPAHGKHLSLRLCEVKRTKKLPKGSQRFPMATVFQMYFEDFPSA